MIFQAQITDALAIIGLASSLLVVTSMAKLLIALKRHGDFGSAITSRPPRDAYKSKVFWITGASSGIGQALALHLSSNYDGVKLILSARRRDVLDEVASKCKKLGATDVKVLQLDLADHASLPSVANEALSLFGRVDVLMNNGGVSTRSFARNMGFGTDKFVMDVNCLSYVCLTKALLPSWEGPVKEGHDFGRSVPTIINTSSIAGKVGAPVRTAYCAAKHAIHGWFDAFRIEQGLIGDPINVTNVVLGSTKTDVARNALTTSSTTTFGSSDANIENGLEPDFVVGRVLAAAYAGQAEMWVAPRKELLLLYLTQYVPTTARKVWAKAGVQYAVEKIRRTSFTVATAVRRTSFTATKAIRRASFKCVES